MSPKKRRILDKIANRDKIFIKKNGEIWKTRQIFDKNYLMKRQNIFDIFSYKIFHLVKLLVKFLAKLFDQKMCF